MSEQLTEGAPAALVDLVQRLESEPALDAPAAVLERATRPLDAPGLNRLLSGAWMGHALHPLLTDIPIGCWTSALLLDLFGGQRSRPAAQGLMVLGLVSAVPTVASGIVEWRRTDGPDRRVGVVHAVLNSVGTLCYVRSVLPRARGRRFRAAGWSLAGTLVATAAGYLGGHLAVARKVGTRDVALSDAPSPNGHRRDEPARSSP